MATQPADLRPLILVIDEVPEFVRLIELELGFQGYRTRSVLISEEPLKMLAELRPDCVVLGSAIPTPNIYDLLTDMRAQASMPIIFLHTAGNESDAKTALDMGATDALGRPFTPEDLGLRIGALLHTNDPALQPIQRGRLVIDILRRTLQRDGMTVALPTTEWGLLLRLANADGPLSPTELLVSVWGPHYAGEITFLRLWLGRLRTSLGDDPRNPEIVLGDEESGFFLAADASPI